MHTKAQNRKMLLPINSKSQRHILKFRENTKKTHKDTYSKKYKSRWNPKNIFKSSN